jgi:DNA helicase-2/ATP-dependent DNA helicase PcrA
MPIPQAEKDVAIQAQDEAARDAAAQVLVVAGPGTGKSSSIEARVLWLLSERAIEPHRICTISFTRASATDLRGRIDDRCTLAAVDSSAVRVSTIHSLALGLLRKAGMLARFAVRPTVLDEWEIDNIFNAEFSDLSGITPTRCDEIRRFHEAEWSTGTINPPNYVPPVPPIDDEEIRAFAAFHQATTDVYQCVLPGEIVRQCVDEISGGRVSPTALFDFGQLIVDEYQDLNPYDLRFVQSLIAAGVPTFVAGDDDQSIYSFRHADPSGIQGFAEAYPNARLHHLDGCWRCTPAIVGAAVSLIEHYGAEGRIPKALRSLYATSEPPMSGILRGWRFAYDGQEARVLARSIRGLIDAGLAARQILILISNRKVQAWQLHRALAAEDIPFEFPTKERFVDRPPGRALLAVLRIVCNRDDYVAHRTLLDLLPGVGSRTCRQISETVQGRGGNYHDLFYGLAPLDGLTNKQTMAIEAVASALADTVGWAAEDSLEDRRDELVNFVERLLGAAIGAACSEFLTELPDSMTLVEARDFAWADQDEAQARILLRVRQRAGESLAEADVLPPRVRVMTMHGAKGLSARVVFIPGLEEEVLPGEKRRSHEGLVMEGARMLYVSITRARAACFLSYSMHRLVNGERVDHTRSQYLDRVGVAFPYRSTELTPEEIQTVVDTTSLL